MKSKNRILRGNEYSTENLSSQIHEAIEDDRERKLIDETKKRVVLTAKNYDEFRHLVASANQKRLSREEIESLQDEKKGWGSVSGHKPSQSSSIRSLGCNLRSESEELKQNEVVSNLISSSFHEQNETSSNQSNPSLTHDISEVEYDHNSTLEFKRDWDRIKQLESGDGIFVNQMLRKVGWRKCHKLFSKSMEIALLEDLIVHLYGEGGGEEVSASVKLVWGVVLSSSHRFELNLSLLPSSLPPLLSSFISSLEPLQDCNWFDMGVLGKHKKVFVRVVGMEEEGGEMDRKQRAVVGAFRIINTSFTHVK